MRLSKVIERLYLKVFVGIVVTPHETAVSVALTKGNEVVQSKKETFETTAVSEAMVNFIESNLSETPLYYIACLNPAESQGAIPVCSEKEAEAYTDLSTALTLCHDKGWMLYTSKPEVDALQRRYRSFGVDFIFSPFVVMEHFFADKVNAEASLYVLVQESQLSIAVFEEGRLLFGDHAHVETEEVLPEEETHISFDFEGEGLGEGIHLDDIDAIDDLEGLDDLGSIEDLDAIEDIDEFAEEISDFREQHGEDADAHGGDALEAFGIDYKRFETIQRALQRFYGEERYENKFVENVYIADAFGVSDDMKRYLEEELFLKVVIRHIDLAGEVVKLAKREAEHAV